MIEKRRESGFSHSLSLGSELNLFRRLKLNGVHHAKPLVLPLRTGSHLQLVLIEEQEVGIDGSHLAGNSDDFLHSNEDLSKALEGHKVDE